ncbi:mucin-5AC-like [Saccostrea cucullata]|uniref:mucin-5AC-like n=1 Tax=Saccostrea cuccullata TaxID=36930 RepID=UPI002ED2447D
MMAYFCPLIFLAFSLQSGSSNMNSLPGKCDQVITTHCDIDCRQIDSVTGCVTCKSGCRNNIQATSSGGSSLSSMSTTASPMCPAFPSTCPRGSVALVNGCPICTAFLFTITKNTALGSCQPNFLCPPMCLKKTTSGCDCDCSNMDPSHPGNLGGNPNQQMNSGGQVTLIGTGCNTNWMNCRSPCAAAVNPTSGCVECNCPQIMTSSPVTQSQPVTTSYRSTASQSPKSSTITSAATTKGTTSRVSSKMTSRTPSTTTTTQSFTTSQKTTTSQPTTTKITTQSTTQTLSSKRISTTAAPPFAVSSASSTKTTNSCPGAIQCILGCKNGFVIDPIPGPDGCPSCSCKTVPTTLKTTLSTTSFKPISFPAHFTISPSVTTPTTMTRPPSSTLRRIICPGVFNCSKTCYTGYRLDSQGCPLCECAPQPTGLP